MVQGFSPPQVMGILNVTQDSFSDGGCYVRRDLALRRAEQMVAEGADIIDVGAESTRPGAQPVSEFDEIERAVSVVDAIAERFDVIVSIDTSKPAVMMAAVAAGATMINDVRALREDGALAAAVQTGVRVCLMHMQGEPRVMQAAPMYDDVVEDVLSFLKQRVDVCLEAGIPIERLLIDPGFGFGKTQAHNLTMLNGLNRFNVLDVPLLVGLSRKSFIGAILDNSVHERLPGSLAAATLALWHGAAIIRVHDVAETVDIMKICYAVQNAGHGSS